MKHVFLTMTALALLAAQAQAQEPQPSFDCAKASSAAEKAICEDDQLKMMDRVLARIYRAARQKGGKTIALAQRAWIGQRNACGEDFTCLYKTYVRRIYDLARAAGDAEGISGEYEFHIKDGEWSSNGGLWLAREPDGALSGNLNSVTGRTAHICDITFERARRDGKVWRWTNPDPQDDQEEACVLTIAPVKGGVKVDGTPGCRDFCGASGYFATVYKKVR